MCVMSHFSHVQLFVTPWTAGCKAAKLIHTTILYYVIDEETLYNRQKNK